MVIKIGEVEYAFAQIIWNNEPIASGELAKICSRELNWRRTTTYSILKKLCNKGLFQNKGGIVSSLISSDQFQAIQCETFVNEHCNACLPEFVSAFCSRVELSEEDRKKMMEIISGSVKNGFEGNQL